MSPVNEELPVAELDPLIERLVTRTRSAIGASDRIPVRILIYFITIAGICTLAPIPANIIGVAAVALLALDTATHRR
jgi:hypothetical protein